MKQTNEQITERRDILTIPGYLVQEIGDCGMSETLLDDDTVEKDDLRVCIVLSGGTKVVLDGSARIIVGRNDDITIDEFVTRNV